MGDGYFVAYNANEMIKTLNRHLLAKDVLGLRFEGYLIRDRLLSLDDLSITWHSNSTGWRFPWKEWIEVRRNGRLTATIPAGGTYEYHPVARYRAIALVFKKAGWPIPLRSTITRNHGCQQEKNA